MNGTNAPRFERVNIMLAPADRQFLQELSQQILEQSGAQVSGSELLRAGLAVLKELHRFDSLARCASGAAITAMGVMTVRAAKLPRATHQPAPA
jgi:hypothetical protein